MDERDDDERDDGEHREMTPNRGERTPEHRVALRILDHQVVGPDDELLGNVDDLELVISSDGWSVTALLVGPAALGQRLPGRLGRWTVAIWQRLQTDPGAQATRVPVAEVRDIGSAITVSQDAARALAASFGLELWLRRFVVTRIPGAKGGGDERAEGRHADDAPTPEPLREAAEWGHGGQTGSVADVLGARVFADDGSELGVVHELLCAEPGRGRDHLRVTHVQYGHHRAGAKLGYDSDARQGPLAVGVVVRWWQRGLRVAPIDDVVDLDVDAGTLRVRSHPHHAHPHAL